MNKNLFWWQKLLGGVKVGQDVEDRVQTPTRTGCGVWNMMLKLWFDVNCPEMKEETHFKVFSVWKVFCVDLQEHRVHSEPGVSSGPKVHRPSSQKRWIQPKGAETWRHTITCRSARLELHPVVFQRFAAVIMRIREPRTTALIFSSGKMVCTGAKRSVRPVELQEPHKTTSILLLL